MNPCIFICDSGNYAIKLSKRLEQQGYYSEVTSTPCKLATGGCSYCVKCAGNLLETVKRVAKENNIRIRAIYEVRPELLKNNYIPL